MEKEIKRKGLTREQEIEVLQSLKGDTYFAYTYGGDAGIDRMCENIRNDYPLDLGSEHEQTIAELRREKRDAVEKERCRLYALVEMAVKCKVLDDPTSEFYSSCAAAVGQSQLIKMKLASQRPIASAEVKSLLDTIDYFCIDKKNNQ